MEGLRRLGGVAGRTSSWLKCVLLVCCSLHLVAVVVAQGNSPNNNSATSPAAAPPLPAEPPLSPAELAVQEQCVGVFLTYGVVTSPVKIPPYASDLKNQPYMFESEVNLTNYGYEELQAWELSVDFQYKEIIAQADGVLFLNGKSLPGYQTTSDTRIVGTTTTALLTSIETADDLSLISTSFSFTGTEFGYNESNPLPTNMSLVNNGYNCTISTSNVVPQNQLWVCCTENVTALNSTNTEGDFFPRQSGDIIMSYDVMTASDSQYTAQVSILMNDPIGRIDNWNLTWQWTQGEFIDTMLGGQVLGGNDQDLCVYGAAAVQYPDYAFQNAMSCSPNPVLIDLDQYQSTNPDVAIPYCCRNGTLLPDLIDPKKSRSDFQLTVKKLPPNLALDDITPPSNWNIAEGYTCNAPIRVAPVAFTPEALHSSSAVASWQVVCNATVVPVSSPKKCCVSFSGYYNDSVIPCPTCSCGCSGSPPTFPWNGQACNSNINALLLPYQAIPYTPSNRTILAQEQARLDHYAIPNGQPGSLPCPDNCGVSINWHVYSNYANGWSARISLFNWDTQAVVNWSSAVEMPVAMPGLQQVYSFNGTLVPDVAEFNNTLFMQGHDGYDNFYLNGKDDSDVPGKLQSILSFDKTKTPGINVPHSDGFPTKVWFNGEECRIPAMVPAGDAWRLLPTFQFAIVVAVSIFLMAGENFRLL